MKVFIFAFFVWTSVSLSSCGNRELDKIEFIDDFYYVQKSIIEFDSLLTYSNKKCRANYSFGFSDMENGIEITDSRGSKEAVKVKLSLVCPEARAEVKRLREIAKILKRNSISYVYKKYGTSVSLFGYRYSSRTHEHSLREILIDNKNNKLVMLNSYRPIDAKGRLILFALNANN